MNWFDIFVAVVLIVSVIRGFSSGLVMQVATLTGVILGAIFAGKLAALITPHLLDLTKAGPHVIGPLSFIVAFIIIYMVAVLIGKMLQSLIKAMKINLFNRIVGAAFCTIKWFFLLSIMLNVVVEFDQHQLIIKPDVRKHSQAYPYVKSLATELIPYLRFDWIPQLPDEMPRIPMQEI